MEERDLIIMNEATRGDFRYPPPTICKGLAERAAVARREMMGAAAAAVFLGGGRGRSAIPLRVFCATFAALCGSKREKKTDDDDGDGQEEAKGKQIDVHKVLHPFRFVCEIGQRVILCISCHFLRLTKCTKKICLAGVIYTE